MSGEAQNPDERRVYVWLLGAPRWRIVDREYPLSPRDALLFAILALHGPQPRTIIGERIWPEAQETRRLGNLRQRQFRLGRQAGTDLFSTGEQLSLLDSVTVDASDINGLSFEQLLQSGELLEGVDFVEIELRHQLSAEREAAAAAVATALGSRARTADEVTRDTQHLTAAVDQLSIRYPDRQELLDQLRDGYARGDIQYVSMTIQQQRASRSRADKSVFISYRRQDGAWALNVYQWLTQHGFDVFIDYSGIGSGSFEAIIVANILARAHFLVVLSPKALYRCRYPKDWLRREVEQAIEAERNIIPLLIDGFHFDQSDIQELLTGDLFHLQEYNGLVLTAPMFQSQMESLVRRFLSVSLDAVIHPPSVQALKAAKKQQAAANSALAVEQLQQMRAEAARLSAELATTREALAAFQCPHCGAYLFQRGYGSESVEYQGREVDLEHEWESFECGYAVADGREQSPCKQSDA